MYCDSKKIQFFGLTPIKKKGSEETNSNKRAKMGGNHGYGLGKVR